MKNIFDIYEISLEIMSKKISSTDLPTFNILRSRLTENMNQVRLYGDTSSYKSDRAMIIDSLNRMAIASFDKTFDKLGNSDESWLNKFDGGIDIVVYVALKEEFDHLIDIFGKGFKAHELDDIAISIYYGNLKSFSADKTYKVAIIPAGKMGNTRSGNIMSAILTKYKTKNVVVIGIAGSITNDLQPGDVFIPDSVLEYLANSEISGSESLSFVPSGNQLPTNPRLLNRFQLLRTSNETVFKRWTKLIKKQSCMIVDEETKSALEKIGLNFPLECKLIVGDDKILGSGPAVAKGITFINWIKGFNRKVAAIEMESSGVYDAAFIQSTAPKTIAIRGISDFADKRKKKIDVVGKGSFRILAVKNAFSLLKFSIQADLFK